MNGSDSNGLGISALRGGQANLLREPYPSELEYFWANPHVSGMAAEDDRVILNPYSPLSAREKSAVVQNETARIMMRTGAVPRPHFPITRAQSDAFGGYGSIQDQRETIAARIATGDLSAGQPTQDQSDYAAILMRLLGSEPAGLAALLSGDLTAGR